MSDIASEAKRPRGRRSALGWRRLTNKNQRTCREPWAPIVAVALLCSSSAAAADLDRLYEPPEELAVAPTYIVPGPIVVAPAPVTLVVPRPAPPPPLRYAPPPVYTEPPPLIAALPIVGPYLVPVPYGPPPATVLDAYDHRFDYNQ